jgi:hypothetical protein
LTINIKRTQSDDFDYFYCSYSFDGNQGFYGISKASLELTNGIYQFVTGADVYTKIRWSKQLEGEAVETFIDSLICKQNSKNIINIY